MCSNGRRRPKQQTTPASCWLLTMPISDDELGSSYGLESSTRWLPPAVTKVATHLSTLTRRTSCQQQPQPTHSRPGSRPTCRQGENEQMPTCSAGIAAVGGWNQTAARFPFPATIWQNRGEAAMPDSRRRRGGDPAYWTASLGWGASRVAGRGVSCRMR